MTPPSAWVDDRSAALLTDLYELTMLQAYVREGLVQEAVFSLFVRRLPTNRNFLVACGLDDVLRYLESLRFGKDALDHLAGREEFSSEFVEWLASFRFTGDVYALPEGTPFFPQEPILEVVAPLPEAQLIETFVMNQIHLQTVLATKAARVAYAAAGRAVVDFGLRRMHGADAGVKGARAFYVGGIPATSNVLAGRIYGIPVAGTLAHSYVQAHDDELTAFREFARTFPETILLVDTYDTLEGVRNVIRLAEEMGEEFRVSGIRLDSGDLGELAADSRTLLDAAGLERVRIFASGGLDEHEIARLVKADAPIDAFGVGTGLGVSADAPSVDLAYKLVSYAGRGRTKLSPEKEIIPGRKQIFRVEVDGRAIRDVVGRPDELSVGRSMLRKVMERGARTRHGRVGLSEARRTAREEIARLPERLHSLTVVDPPYSVWFSERLDTERSEVASMVRRP